MLLDSLKNKDKNLGAAIDKIGMIKHQTNPDLFSALVYSIVGQQITTKAHTTIWERMNNRLFSIAPQTILVCTIEEMKDYAVKQN